MVDPSSPRYATGLRRIAEGLTEQPLGVVVQTLYGVPEEDIEAALQEQKGTGGKLGDILVRRGNLTEEQLAACLAILVKKWCRLYYIVCTAHTMNTAGKVIQSYGRLAASTSVLQYNV